jgi:hypothetical protein
MKHNILSSLKAGLKRVRVACSSKYAKQQQLKTEFASLVPIEYSPDQCPAFVSRVCPPATPSPYNVVVLHSSVVARRRRQQQVADKLFRQSARRFNSYLGVKHLKLDDTSPRDCRVRNFITLMVACVPREGVSRTHQAVGPALVLQPEIYELVLAARKKIFAAKLSKLAAEGRLRLPRKGCAANSA